MKSILLFMPYGSVGGMERLAYTFYKKYKELGYKVYGVKIIGLNSDIINFGEDEIALSLKDFVEYSKIDRIKFYLSIPFKLRQIIIDKKIDYTISFGDMANCFSALTKTKENKIASIHSLKSVEITQLTLMNKLFIKSYKTIYKRFNKVVCISKGIKQDLINNFSYAFDNLKVIYNPHDVQYIVNKSKEEIGDIAESKIFNKETIIFLGRFSIQKSPWHLINAFYKSKNENRNLVFIGDGNEEVFDFLKKQVKDLKLENQVFFLGRKSNPYKYLKRAKILALSSLYEGTPNVIAEAIALGIPIISSNCTEGIVEMMSYKKKILKEEIIFTESGLITPNLFKKKLEIPRESNFIEEELVFSKAIDLVFDSYSSYRIDIEKHKGHLMSKFELEKVCYDYLNL